MSVSFHRHPELIGKTGDELRAMANRSHKAAEDSFDRCDTDGFLSQWASGIMGRLYNLAAGVADEGWTHEFDELFAADTGERLHARIVDTQFGASWVYDTEHGPVWVHVSRAATDAKQAKHYAKKGVTLGTIRQPALVAMAGSGRGMSGQAWPVVLPDNEKADEAVVVTVDKLAEVEVDA